MNNCKLSNSMLYTSLNKTKNINWKNWKKKNIEQKF